MEYFDLLYPSEEKRIQGRKKSISKSLLSDLQMHELVKNGLIEETDYQFLMTEMEYLPTDPEIIQYRQTILLDLIRNPIFMNEFENLCTTLREKVTDKKYDIWEPATPIYKNLLEYIRVLSLNKHILFNTKLTIEHEMESDLFRNVLDFLQTEDYSKALSEIITQMKSVLESDAIQYRVSYAYGKVIQYLEIDVVHSDQVAPTIKKRGLLKKNIVNDSNLISADNIILSNNLNEMYTKTIIKLCELAARINNVIVLPLKKMAKELRYYRIAIKIYNLCNEARIHQCMPDLTQRSRGRLAINQLCPLQLFQPRMQRSLTTNDYSNEDGKIAIITGANSGGKTIFIQSLGIAQIFMQLGYFVPAMSYDADVMNYIGSLFTNIEDVDTIHGKLEQELVDVKEIAKELKPNSMLLMNEILATTSEKEAAQIMAEIIRAFSVSESNILCATHMCSFAEMVEDKTLILESGQKAINYIAEQRVDENNKRYNTYHIIKGKPNRIMWEDELIQKYIPTK